MKTRNWFYVSLILAGLAIGTFVGAVIPKGRASEPPAPSTDLNMRVVGKTDNLTVYRLKGSGLQTFLIVHAVGGSVAITRED